ncbi:hypothetical protein B5F17_08270 [Butyricicoccus pullicaecorum]|uniref:Uncharacterized protein n=1 Tax=Butyricicoccus pullicaecorum TaxID=501571 RepID=A0A1Y4LB17_9FIRM|nr:hypothetical protein [Butyricicoccus pullicaecorum]OUP52689.1 hypothetical protein B5F17_08270 [Butyricicoccus pullicaecorum]
MNEVVCRDCGSIYTDELDSCPKCGSKKKEIYFSVKSTLDIPFEVTEMRGKKPHLTGKKKNIWEWTNKKTVRGDNGTPVRRYKLIDRENDWYEEVVTDLTTGEVSHECKQKLSEHTGHGSAKFKNKIEQEK